MKINARLMSWLCQGLYWIVILFPFLRELLAADTPRKAGLAAAPLVLLTACVAAGFAWHAFGEKRLTGSPLMFGRGALLAFGLLVVLVPLPLAYAQRSPGPGDIYGLTFGLGIWAMVVVPFAGVLIAYHLIGDGSPKAARRS